MSSSENHKTTRERQQEQINRDPMKTPATDTASAHPRDVERAASSGSGRRGGGEGESAPPSNPNQPGSDAAAQTAQHGHGGQVATSAPVAADVWRELSDRSDPGSEIASETGGVGRLAHGAQPAKPRQRSPRDDD